MSEDLPELPPTNARRHDDVRPARDQAGRPGAEQGGERPRDKDEKLPPEHPDDRSPADPHDWQEDWDRARWAP